MRNDIQRRDDNIVSQIRRKCLAVVDKWVHITNRVKSSSYQNISHQQSWYLSSWYQRGLWWSGSSSVSDTQSIENISFGDNTDLVTELMNVDKTMVCFDRFSTYIVGIVNNSLSTHIIGTNSLCWYVIVSYSVDTHSVDTNRVPTNKSVPAVSSYRPSVWDRAPWRTAAEKMCDNYVCTK